MRLAPLHRDPQPGLRQVLHGRRGPRLPAQEVQFRRPPLPLQGRPQGIKFHDAVAVLVAKDAAPHLTIGVAGRLKPQHAARRRGIQEAAQWAAAVGHVALIPHQCAGDDRAAPEVFQGPDQLQKALRPLLQGLFLLLQLSLFRVVRGTPGSRRLFIAEFLQDGTALLQQVLALAFQPPRLGRQLRIANFETGGECIIAAEVAGYFQKLKRRIGVDANETKFGLRSGQGCSERALRAMAHWLVARREGMRRQVHLAFSRQVHITRGRRQARAKELFVAAEIGIDHRQPHPGAPGLALGVKAIQTAGVDGVRGPGRRKGRGNRLHDGGPRQADRAHPAYACESRGQPWRGPHANHRSHPAFHHDVAGRDFQAAPPGEVKRSGLGRQDDLHAHLGFLLGQGPELRRDLEQVFLTLGHRRRRSDRPGRRDAGRLRNDLDNTYGPGIADRQGQLVYRHLRREPTGGMQAQIFQQQIHGASRDDANDARMPAMVIANAVAEAHLLQKAAHLIGEQALSRERQAARQLQLHLDRALRLGRQVISGRNQQDRLRLESRADHLDRRARSERMVPVMRVWLGSSASFSGPSSFLKPIASR